MTQPEPSAQPPTDPDLDKQQVTKLAIDLAPLLIFFGTYMTLGIYWATGVLMVTTVLSMILSRVMLGHVSPTLLMTTALVLAFGALTFWFNDSRFIKMKPTIIYLLFAALLFGGQMTGRPTLRLLLGETFHLTADGWRGLTYRWAAFFVALAALNEVVWRNFSETTWASLKVFGFLPLTMLFFASQYGFIQRHHPDKSAQSAG